MPEQRYGVALFDNPKKYASGWAAVGDEIGAEPFSFQDTGELENNVIWITNIDKNTFFRCGLSKTPRFRHEYYLRTKLSSIVLELDIKNEDLSIQAVKLASLVATVMQLTHYHVGMSGAPANTLATGLRQVIQPDSQAVDNVLRDASKKASQSFVECVKSHELINKDYRITSLVFHRRSYAKLITSYKLPYGEWLQAPSEVLAMSNRSMIEWVCKNDRPCLVKVRVLNINSSVNHLVNYGAGAGLVINRTDEGKDWAGLNQREWMTTPEINVMRKYMDLIVEDILIGEGYVENPIRIPKWGVLSYCAGIMCENMWVALTKDLSGSPGQNPQSAWIHSIDRTLCFLAAKGLDLLANTSVQSYGYGRVTICIDNGGFRQVADLAVRMKMVAPMAPKGEEFNRVLNKEANAPLVLNAIMERRGFDLLEKLDREAIGEAKIKYEIKNNKSSAQISL